jgi:hypothetical protein
MPEHDWSSDHCTLCALPIRAHAVPCEPSTADDPASVARVKEIADAE